MFFFLFICLLNFAIIAFYWHNCFLLQPFITHAHKKVLKSYFPDQETLQKHICSLVICPNFAKSARQVFAALHHQEELFRKFFLVCVYKILTVQTRHMRNMINLLPLNKSKLLMFSSKCLFVNISDVILAAIKNLLIIQYEYLIT